MANGFANELCFIALPYLAAFIFLLGIILRYRLIRDSWASFSAQFPENHKHSWASAPFRYSLITVLVGHFVAFLVPQQILAWNSRPARLYILEITALIFGLLALVALVGAIFSGAGVSKGREVANGFDWVVMMLLLVQIACGVCVAVFYPWGSSWFAAAIAPYLWSLVRFKPALGYVALMPVLVRMHVVLAYVLIVVAPFTRLVHVLIAPNPYLWRRSQAVQWVRASKEAV